jgi:hypothetical protein
MMWWGIAAVVIIAGFADLARGGETIAPILLAIGYCILDTAYSFPLQF